MKNGLALLCCFFFVLPALGQKGYMHPETQIIFVKKQIEKKTTPFYSAYLQLLEAADSAINMPDHALADFSVPGYYQNPKEHKENSLSLQTDAFNAYSCALAYHLGAGQKYGEKAYSILNAWAETNKKYSEYDGTLVMAYSGTAMMIAAQLMSGTEYWKDHTLFDQWAQDVYRKACNEIRNRKNNWADWGRFGSLLCATYFGDEDEIKENTRLIKSDLFHKIATDGSMPEETKREKNGIWYTYFSLAPITAACWLVYNNTGEDLFTWEENGVSIKSAIDYLSYYNQHPQEWKWFKEPNTGKPDRWPGNLLDAMSGIYNDPDYVKVVEPNRPLMYPIHHFAWTFPTLMPLTLSGYTE